MPVIHTSSSFDIASVESRRYVKHYDNVKKTILIMLDYLSSDSGVQNKY